MLHRIVTLSFLLISASLPAQLSWDSISLKQLGGPLSNKITSMVADEEGVWLASDAGLNYWRGSTKVFENSSDFRGTPIKKIERDDEFVYVLTDKGRLSKIKLYEDTPSPTVLSGDGITVLDFDVDNNRIAFITEKHGLIVQEDDGFKVYEKGDPIIGDEPLLSVALAGDLIYVGTNSALHCSNGLKYNEDNQLPLTQFYRLGYANGTLYIAGLQVNGRPGIYTLGEFGFSHLNKFHSVWQPVVKSFCLDTEPAHIASDIGYYSFNSSTNGWDWKFSSDPGDTVVLDVVTYDGQIWIGTDDFGVNVQQEGYGYWLTQRTEDEHITRMFEWHGDIYAITRRRNLIRFDEGSQRLVHVSALPYYHTLSPQVVINKFDEAFAVTESSFINLTTNEEFLFPRPYWLFSSIYPQAFIIPEKSTPAVRFDSVMYFLETVGVSEVANIDSVLDMDVYQVKNDAEDNAYFVGNTKIIKWTGGSFEDQNFSSQVTYAPNTYRDVFFNGVNPVYNAQYFLVYVDGTRHYYRDSIPTYIELGKLDFGENRMINFGRDTTVIFVHNLEGLTLENELVAPISANFKIGAELDAENQIWVASTNSIYRAELTFDEVEPDKFESNTFYPIPTSGILHIATTDLYNLEWTLTIVSMSGELMRNEKVTRTNGQPNFDVDVSALAPGVYYVQLTGINFKASSKFIVENH